MEKINNPRTRFAGEASGQDMLFSKGGCTPARIKAAVIGLGRIAGLLEDDPLREKPCTHAGALAANPDCLLAAGMDINEERRRSFGERWNCPVYDNAEVMIKAHSPDILVVATHPDSHERYCRLAAAYKVPVAICEKPLAGSLRKARRIAALERSGPIRIITNHERRYSEDYVRAKAILDEGRLGRILSVRALLYMGRGRRILDVLWHDGTHMADALMFLSSSRMKHRKTWGAKLSHNAGTTFLAGELEKTGTPGAPEKIPFLFELGAGRDHLVFEAEFSCERGRLRIGNGIFEIWESLPSPYAAGFRSLKKTAGTFEGPTAYFANMVKDAAACVRDPRRKPRSAAADGLGVIEYLHSVGPIRDGRI